MTDLNELARSVAQRLTAESGRIPANRFVQTMSEARQSGMYAWFVDPAGDAMLRSEIGVGIGPLIYTGQAGATSSRSRKASPATLGSRIASQHIRGTISGRQCVSRSPRFSAHP